DKAQLILAKKEADRPITAEDYLVLDRFVAGVEGRVIDARAVEYDEIRKERAAARKQVPEKAWELELEELDLPLTAHNALADAGYGSVGDVLYRLELDDNALLEIEEIDEEKLALIHERIAETEDLWVVEEPVEPEVAEAEEAEEAPVAEAEVAQAEAVAEAEAVEEAEVAAAEAEEIEEPVVAEAEEEAVAEAEEEPAVAEAEPEAAEAVEEVEEEEVEEEEEEEVPDIEDLSTSLVDLRKKEKEKKQKDKKGKVVVVSRSRSRDDDDGEEEDEESVEQRKGRQLVFDEEAGRVVTKRKRKRGRRRPDWEDYEDMDVDDLLEDEF
ncbi:MAG: hypothetical protein ACOC8X_01515, partial [Chloroflexota bacterium]